MNMKSILPLTLVPVLLATLRADDVTAERFPDADTVTVDESERVAYRPDGTYESVSESRTKILTEKGRRESSVVTLDYSRRYGEAAIVFVRAIGTNGVERAIDVSATTKESTDNGSMGVNIYDPLDRKITCTVPGLAIGETLHVKTRRRTHHPRCENQWADISVHEWTRPILRSTYEVTAPASRPLRSIAIRHPLGNVTSNRTVRADGSIVYTFTSTNSPQAFPEPSMPPLFTEMQSVRVSTAADWREISRWYWELSAPHLAQTNAAMIRKVAELRAKAGEGELLRALFRFVSQEVRYMGLTMEDTSPGYAPHDVSVTFDNRYGVCRDKAALLVSLLRLAGFKAFPVLIHVGAKLDPDVPQPFFNHAIVAVASPSTSTSTSYLLMDPTNENTKDLYPAYLSNCSYLVCRPEGENLATSPVPSADHNALAVTSRGSLLKDGSLFLESDLAFGGLNDTIYRGAFARRTPEERVRLFERLVGAVAPGAELLACAIEPEDLRNTERPFRARLSLRLPEAVVRGTTQDELVLPFLTKGLGAANFLLDGETALAQRKYTLRLDSTASVTERVEVGFGAALGRPLRLPPPSAIEGGYRYARTFAATGTTLVATRRLDVAAVEFSPDEYRQLRADIQETEAAERERAVFAVDPVQDADTRTILDSSETTVFSDSAWVTTNVIVREVLTYAGKKSSAELKFPYNPTWKDVRILSATISNRNGRVARATARETNVMDAGWVSAAPRYPAGKILIVNLPSVEIGSVISYTVVTTVTNAPASFYAEYAFDSTAPLERRVVRVNGWRREVVRPARIPSEPSAAPAGFGRDRVIVSSNDFARAAERLRAAADVPAVSLPEGAVPSPSPKALRDWMARYVRVVGPSLYDVPLARQLTDPETVLRERYATRLDYVRTLCALLRGAGHEADIVFAASDADAPDWLRRRQMTEAPRVRAFADALCRVRVSTGGFLGFGGETKTYFLGTENEYVPLGATAYEGADLLDPETGAFGLVTVPEAELSADETETRTFDIRENGATDIVIEETECGFGVGAFRRRYAEMLPEDRSRHHQELLGAIAEAATATGELETDVEGYPARRKFACYVPDYAVVAGETITLDLAGLLVSLPNIPGRVRRTPFAVPATGRARQEFVVRFPAGYTLAEHLPEPFDVKDPERPDVTWLCQGVTSSVTNGALEVRLVRETARRSETDFKPDGFASVQDARRRATSRANRTIVVRRRP